MKKTALFISFVMLMLNLFSQAPKATIDDLMRFKTSTTFVVLEQDPFSYFNSSIRPNLELFWKVTPYKVIDYKEFETLKHDSKNSFLFISLAQIVKTTAKFVVLNLCMGEKSGEIEKMPEIISLPLAYYMEVDDEESDEDVNDPDYTYKLGGLLQTIQFYAVWRIQNPNQDVEEFVKKSTTQLKDKELWLLAKELPKDLQSPVKIQQIYPYTVKFVTEKEIEEAIKSKKSNVVYLHKIGHEEYKLTNVYCFKTLLSCEDGRPYYINYHTISKDKPDAFLKEDFQKIGEVR